MFYKNILQENELKSMKRKHNYMIWIVAIMLLAFQMSSCSEHIDDWHGNVATGSILLSDNSIIAIHGYDASKMTAVGVVIGTRQDSMWVVSTKNLGQAAYLDTLISVPNVSADENTLCGINNTSAILKFERKSPAVKGIINFSSPVKGWALPSIGELRMLSNNISTIGKIMEKIGGDAFLTAPYLSSTQDGTSTQTEEFFAKCISLHSGYISSILKTDSAQVRPILRMRIN